LRLQERSHIWRDIADAIIGVVIARARTNRVVLVGASNFVSDSRWAGAELLPRSAHWSTTRSGSSLGGEIFRNAAWRSIIGVVERHRLNAVE
jgi:hypothetical protein